MPDTPLSVRIDYYGIDRLSPSAFSGVSRALDRRLDSALKNFYATISSRKDLADHFTGQQSMDRAKSQQAKHWEAVFRDGVDERFKERAIKIGNVHARIGLEPKWYVGSYSLVLEELVNEICAPGWQRFLPWKRAQAEQIIALIKVSLLDIDLALSGYFVDREEKTRGIVDRMGSALEQLAEGNLTVSLADFPELYQKVELDFNRTVGSLNGAVTSVISGVDSIATGSAEIRSASNDLARRTEEQAANLEETAAAIARTNERVQSTVQITEKARSTIETANMQATDGSQIVAEAVTAMDQIKESSEEINNIIAIIDSIAFQTNLLALNAGVEAARAGETGKGFAVVASEVRALAQRCTDAADDVKKLISSSSQQVNAGVDLVSRSGEAFASIVKDVSDLSVSIQEIASSTSDQADSLAQINTVVGDLDRSTQQNAAMSEQCTAAASSLATEADKLRKTVDKFETSGENGAVGGAGSGPRLAA